MTQQDLYQLSLHKDVLIYDGECVLCNGYITYMLKYDTYDRVLIAPLQSNAGSQFLNPEKDSVYLLRKGKLYDQSDVGLRVAQVLPFPHNIPYAFLLVPKQFRNVVYRWVARNRFRWFGKNSSCQMISREHQHKLIDFPYLPGAEL